MSGLLTGALWLLLAAAGAASAYLAGLALLALRRRSGPGAAETARPATSGRRRADP